MKIVLVFCVFLMEILPDIVSCQEYYVYSGGDKKYVIPDSTMYIVRYDSSLDSAGIRALMHTYGMDIDVKESDNYFKYFEIPESLIDSVAAVYKSENVLYLRPYYLFEITSERFIIQNKITVRYNDSLSETQKQEIIIKYGLTALDTLNYEPNIYYIYELPYDKKSNEFLICAELFESNMALSAQPNMGIFIDDPIDSIKIPSEIDVPSKYSLKSAYPNPFNPSTTISFTLSQQSEVRIEIFNLLGQKVTTLADETLPAGTYSRIWNASRFGSGIYFVRMEARDFVKTQKVTLLK